jgi:hypothetical protein
MTTSKAQTPPEPETTDERLVPTEGQSEPQEGEGEISRDEALRQSYSAATTRLREAHLDEFNALRQEEAKNRGVDWTPPPTEEQKAAAELEAIFERHPHLREKYAQGLPPVYGDGDAEAGQDF